MLAVMRAIAGTNRPDIQIISSVETATATTSGTAGRFVTSRIGGTEARDISVKTRLLPERSAQRPIQFMLNIVQKPPQIIDPGQLLFRQADIRHEVFGQIREDDKTG